MIWYIRCPECNEAQAEADELPEKCYHCLTDLTTYRPAIMVYCRKYGQWSSCRTGRVRIYTDEEWSYADTSAPDS